MTIPTEGAFRHVATHIRLLADQYQATLPLSGVTSPVNSRSKQIQNEALRIATGYHRMAAIPYTLKFATVTEKEAFKAVHTEDVAKTKDFMKNNTNPIQQQEKIYWDETRGDKFYDSH